MSDEPENIDEKEEQIGVEEEEPGHIETDLIENPNYNDDDSEDEDYEYIPKHERDWEMEDQRC